MTDKKGMLYCLRVHHDNASWIVPYFTRKERVRGREMCHDMGYYCETVNVR